MIPVETDIIHEHGEQKNWNESFYFSFYDRGNDICGFMRLGLKPNRNEKMLFCFFMMPDGSLVGTKESLEFDGDTLTAKGVTFAKVEDEKVWNLVFDGELPGHKKGEDSMVKVRFDLRFEGLNPMFNYRECMASDKEALAAAVASEHLEQMGKVLGQLSIDGKDFYVKALGERDHSWGERDWTAPRAWVWLTCQFNDGYGFNITKLYMDKGDVDAGFLYVDGENLPIVKVDMVTEYDADGSPNTLYLAMYDKDGVVYGVKGEIKKKAVMEFKGDDHRGSIMFENLARYRIDDDTDEVGFGIAEYLFRK
jgi:hypothetical protein